MKFVFIADFFVEHILGGGELNNEECIEILISKKHSVEKIQSHAVTPAFINKNKNSNFIIANFINLRSECIQALLETKYIIYEHDHKYLETRNPAAYENFKAPKEDIINLDFYKNAKAVLCQSQFHMDIIRKNTDLSNLINLSGNIWSVSALEMIEEISDKPKEPKCSIMDSAISHKNTRDAVNLCIAKNMEYDLIQKPVYSEFLAALGTNEKFVFLPQTPETLSRVAVEARMMNMSLITNNMVGASKEPWFKLKGKELIDLVYEMRERIPEKVVEVFE
ncbi:hypothetical protein CMI47_14755 [Candidatus Pacearchaeota archaeon]|nr:hypothetical protein [Candidatus Pacearchaeota archaeon]